MTSATLLSSPVQSTRPTFTAAAIHDGLLAGFRAREALGALRHLLAPDFGLRPLAWSFQQLERLDVRAMAQRSASSAQMIIIAGSSGISLPAHVERWLDGCMFEHRVRRTVLVALPEDEILGLADEGTFLRSIRQFAARWQAQVMTGAEFDADVGPEFVRRQFSIPASQPQPLSQRFSIEFEAAPRFYGINE